MTNDEADKALAGNVAYVAIQPFTFGPHDWMVCVCVRNDEGYRPVLDYGTGTKERAERIVSRLNDRLKLTEKEAAIIVASTSPRSRKRGRR